MIPHAHEGEAAIFFSAKVTKVKSSGSTVYTVGSIEFKFFFSSKVTKVSTVLVLQYIGSIVFKFIFLPRVAVLLQLLS